MSRTMVELPAGDVRRAAAVFKALSHPDRLRLACRLAEGPPATQKELLDELGWPQSTLARHVGVLRDLGLVHGDRQGAEVLLTGSGEVMRGLVDAVCGWVHSDRGEERGWGYGGVRP